MLLKHLTRKQLPLLCRRKSERVYTECWRFRLPPPYFSGKNLHCILDVSSATSHHVSSKATVATEEMKKFGNAAEEWWDTKFPLTAPLHTFNAVRVPFIRDGVLNCKQVPIVHRQGPLPLQNYKFLDVGCGGGILCEPLARIGADVTGIDAGEDLIRVAAEHASRDKCLAGRIRYLCTTVEQHAEDNQCVYDAVVCSEVIEHVDNPKLFVEKCVQLVKPNGSLFFTTLSKTIPSWFYNIALGESCGPLPKGTHIFDKLISPNMLQEILESCSMLVEVDGFCGAKERKKSEVPLPLDKR